MGVGWYTGWGFGVGWYAGWGFGTVGLIGCGWGFATCGLGSAGKSWNFWIQLL